MKNIGVVLKGYPRLSETFIAQELLQLQQLGFAITIYSLRHPYDPDTHPVHREINARVVYLPEYLHQQPILVLGALAKLLPRWRLWRTLAGFAADLIRDPSRNRVRRLGQAFVLVQEGGNQHDLLYSHFMHTPASVTRYAANIIDSRWSISAHAKDIWTLPQWETRQKLRDCQWLVTCTKANYEYLQTQTTTPAKVHLLYHGIDLQRFPPATDRARNTGHTLQLVSVGRLVEKKGYRYLLEALATLPDELNWHFTHIGGGALEQQLTQQAQQLGLSANISWLGAKPQQAVLEQFRQSDIFVLPSIIATDGDRDGLPNVLMEAQSQGLVCLSTDVSGIPELITHAETGWLVPEKDTAALAAALLKLIKDHDLRQRLASNGFKNVSQKFSHTVCIAQLEKLLSA